MNINSFKAKYAILIMMFSEIAVTAVLETRHRAGGEARVGTGRPTFVEKVINLVKHTYKNEK